MFFEIRAYLKLVGVFGLGLTLHLQHLVVYKKVRAAGFYPPPFCLCLSLSVW